MNTKITLIAIIAFVVIVGAGAAIMLGNNNDSDNDDLNGTITIQGSTTVAPYMTAVQEKWLEIHPNVTINMTANGSGTGASAAINGTADLAMLSRDLKSTEKDSGLVQTTIGIDGIMTIINKDAGVSDLTTQQLADIFSGKITNWNQVGGNDMTLSVISRESGSGTRDGYEEALKRVDSSFSLTNKAVEVSSTNMVIQSVDNTSGSVGYVSIGYTDNVKAKDNVVISKLNGVDATEDNVKNGSYTIQRDLVLATKGTPTGLTSNIIDWILGAEGQILLKEKGFINIRSTDTTRQTIAIQGSTTVAPYMLKVQETYEQKFSNITMNITANGSGTGASAAINKTADLAMLSRDLKSAEVANGLVQTTIGIDGIMTIINKDAGVSDLSTQQLADIFSGKVTNWNQIGGNDKAISVFSRESGSGTRDGYEEALKNVDSSYSLSVKAIENSSTNAVINSVNNTSGAIGYVSIGYTENVNAKDDVIISKLNGVDATEDNVKNGTYAIQRNLVLATLGTATGATADLINWILGAEGQALLVNSGFISISA